MELTVDGKRVFASTGGRAFDAAEPAVVFIHGAGFDHTAWPLQARYFAHHGRAVLALDLPGHGRSEGPALASIPRGRRRGSGACSTRPASPRRRWSAIPWARSIALAAAARLPERVGALGPARRRGRMPVHPDLLAAAARNDPLGRTAHRRLGLRPGRASGRQSRARPLADGRRPAHDRARAARRARQRPRRLQRL